MADLIDRQAALDAIHCDITVTGRQNAKVVVTTIRAFVDRIKALPSAEPAWIPVTWHRATESELEERPDIAIWFDCDMPNDGDEILVTTGHGYVGKDICYIDDRFYLDSGYEWTEIKAWMPAPAPYRGGKTV